MTRKWIGLAAIGLWLAMVLGACSQTEGDAGIVVKEVRLPNGQTVVCVVINEAGEGPAMDCMEPAR